MLFSFLVLPSLFTLTTGMVVPLARSSGCVGTISSLSDVSAAVQCTTVNIHSFTVPAGYTFSLDLQQGTIVNVLGDIEFGNKSWAGPLFKVQGEDITFNGNGMVWDGGGPYYWDGLGGHGITKPDPMMSIAISGTLSGVHVVNSPQRCFAVSNPGPLVISGVVINDSQGNYPNTRSNDLPAGSNTDGFDVSGDDITIKDSTVINQDDCLAINRGKNITFEDNVCETGHGISIGSISSGSVVEGVVIQRNHVVNSMQALRIKTDKTASNGMVNNITYSANTATNCTNYGLLIDQSYPETFGTPGAGIIISNINFSPGTTNIHVTSDAKRVGVNCGDGSCTGIWDWSSLQTSGGKEGKLNNADPVTGYYL